MYFSSPIGDDNNTSCGVNTPRQMSTIYISTQALGSEQENLLSKLQIPEFAPQNDT